jgi:hypothetical protein
MCREQYELSVISRSAYSSKVEDKVGANLSIISGPLLIPGFPRQKPQHEWLQRPVGPSARHRTAACRVEQTCGHSFTTSQRVHLQSIASRCLADLFLVHLPPTTLPAKATADRCALNHESRTVSIGVPHRRIVFVARGRPEPVEESRQAKHCALVRDSARSTTQTFPQRPAHRSVTDGSSLPGSLTVVTLFS